MNRAEYRRYAEENYVPVVRKETEKILENEVRKSKPAKILEIGTAIGYSGIVMLEASENATLTTLELNQNMYNIAKNNFENENCIHRVIQMLGDAGEILPELTEKYDFIFLDGPKGQYIKYLPHIKRLLNTDGILFTDNVLFQGLIKGDAEIPKKYRTIVRNLREYLETLMSDEDFETQLIEIEDGITISRKIR